ncbi:hypothetical protein [Streptacidiphilus anmyonensis]|uniref:hypothetical protein n=1 Tax=Streptacidiphilus anmyonensis TaxID=405782 RepID=UPI0005A816F4|nr:hypothetical protein [Streptacidiphilus anmyonensis]
MSDRQEDVVEPRLEAAVRRALDTSAHRLPPSAPPLATVLRAGRRRRRVRRAAAGALVTAAAAAGVAALCVGVPLLGSSSKGGVDVGSASRAQATSGASGLPAPAHSPTPTPSPSGSAPGPTVVSIGAGTLAGIDWTAQVSVGAEDLCQHLVIGGTQVDAPAGRWTDCVPVQESQPDGDVGVHTAPGGGLRLLTSFGADTVARTVVTFADGTTRQGDSVRIPGTATEGTVVPIAPGQRISVIDLYDTRGTRVGHFLGYA